MDTQSTAPQYIPLPKVGEKYHHYKGGDYRVITLCRHTETAEELVIYESVQWGSRHARPLSQWFEIVKAIDPDSPNAEVLRFMPANGSTHI